MKQFSGGVAAGAALGVAATLVYTSAARPQPEALGPLPAPYYTVLLENPHVRVVEHRLMPGDSEPMHGHPAMLVYFMDSARVEITAPDGGSFEETLAKGQVLEVDAMSHAIRNVGPTPLHSLLVELKPAAER